ncbi:MAG: ECF transporter S component [Oscillospiraceae bacterium]|nr:ECF transporter S component [Oscillospiraceae bacterium]
MFSDLGKLWAAVADNVTFLLMCLAVFAGIFALAILLERLWLKPEKQSPARRVAYIGIFAAIAALLMYIEFALPFAPGFYELDFSEIPVLICSFSLGPVAGVVCEFVKEMLKLLLKGTSTAFVGDLANFVVGCSFILPASVVYFAKKTKTGAIIGMGVGTAAMTVFGSLFNAVYLIPAFSVLFNMPLEVIIGMGTDINPAIVSVNTLVLFAVVPFNLLKGGLVSVVTFFLYKHIERLLRMK